MKPHRLAYTGAPALFFIMLWACAQIGGQEKNDKGAKPYGIAKRVPWTTSRIKGSPESPLPYRAEMAFPHVAFDFPLDIVTAPGSGRFFVAEQFGKVWSFSIDAKTKKKDLCIDLGKDLQTVQKEKDADGVDQLYGIVFHPNFKQNRYCYLCYVLKRKKANVVLPNGSRVSRFTVTKTDPPRLDPASEKIIITWLDGGHNGGCLKFGPDGCLYISTGDGTGPFPPDGLDTGQDISDLLSSILRIDVDHSDAGKNYRVPPDNPFVKLKGARPEVYAYGLRNPWRMSFDRVAGDLWVGDVGWEKWEMIYRIKKGGNYGWSVMEGPQMVRPNAKVGPTPILPPNLALPHTESASVTGGFVYRGKKYPDLVGTYLCGDWETRKVWGAKFDGDKLVSNRVLAQTGQRVVAFGENEGGELYYLDHDPKSGVWHLVPNQEEDHSKDFPRKLSETGLFSDTAKHKPAGGVIPFSINAMQWIDHAEAERFIALPGTSTLIFYQEPQQVPKSMFQSRYFFPKDAVLVKTITLRMTQEDPDSERRVETQVLHFDGTNWNGYTYQWDDQQTDAVLVPATGASKIFKVKDVGAPAGSREQTWHFFGRGQCLQCHNPWAGYNLAFTPSQLDREQKYGAIKDSQLRTLEHIGILAHGGKDKTAIKLAKPYWKPLVNPFPVLAGMSSVEDRARSYLQVNCAHCHQFGAGGTAQIDLRYDIPLKDMRVAYKHPIQGEFGIPEASIVAPQSPDKSVLFYRMATLGKGRMPHIGSYNVDEPGLHLIESWIDSLEDKSGKAKIHLVFTRQETIGAIKKLGEIKDLLQQQEQIKSWLKDPTNALMVVRAFEDRFVQHKLPPDLRQKFIHHAMKDSPATVRDLFERFIPDAEKIKRLGDVIDPQDILKLTGAAANGKKLFFGAGSQCLKCHRVGSEGQTVGPELTKIGTKLKRAKLLDKLLFPSKNIDPKYLVHTVAMLDGRIYVGQIVEKTAKELVLREVANLKEYRLPLAGVQETFAQKTSLMPEGMLRDLAAQEAADLLAYLESLK
jgi:putative heme-binding domain-containing protein